MGFIESRIALVNRRYLLAAVVPALVAAAILYFGYRTLAQAFRGPRTVSEEELVSEQPQPGDNYLAVTLAREPVDTGVRYGRGTKYLLLPVNNRMLLCSVRTDVEGQEFTGRLETVTGGTELEVLNYLREQDARMDKLLLPYMLQSVRSIWFDTSVYLFFIALFAVPAVWMLVRWVRFRVNPRQHPIRQA